MRSLQVVVPHEGLGHGRGLLQVSWPIEGQALFLVGAVVALDEAILLGLLGVTDDDLDAQTGPKAHQSGGKITARRAAHPAGIAIQGDGAGTAIPGQGEGEGLQSGFGREISPHMGIEQHRGAGINDVEGLDHMLAFALGVSRHAGNIFEIDLPGTHGGGSLQRLMDGLLALRDALMGFEDAVNGLAGRDGQLEELQGRIPFEIVVDGFRAGHAPQAFRGLIANGQDGLHHQGMGRAGWGVAGAGVALPDLRQGQACGQFVPKAFEPFVHPALRTAQGRSQLRMGPVGMVLPERRYIGTCGVV